MCACTPSCRSGTRFKGLSGYKGLLVLPLIKKDRPLDERIDRRANGEPEAGDHEAGHLGVKPWAPRVRPLLTLLGLLVRTSAEISADISAEISAN